MAEAGWKLAFGGCSQALVLSAKPGRCFVSLEAPTGGHDPPSLAGSSLAPIKSDTKSFRRAQACPEVILLTLNSAPQEIQICGIWGRGRWQILATSVLSGSAIRGMESLYFCQNWLIPPELNLVSGWPTDLTWMTFPFSQEGRLP